MNNHFIRRLALKVTRGIGSPLSIVIHTLVFIVSFVAAALGYIEWSSMLLFLTTIVSLEAIYLSIFIQMTINYTTESLEGVEENLEELQENVEEMQEDVGELQEDVEDIQENVEEMSVDEETEEMIEERRKVEQKQTLDNIQTHLRQLLDDVEKLKSSRE